MEAGNGDMEAVTEQLRKSLSLDGDDHMDKYHRSVQEGKDAARVGDLTTALHCFHLAHDLRPSEKLEKRIRKLEDLLAVNDSEEEEFVDVNGCGLMLFKELHDRLYDYQRHGVSFLYGLHRDSLRGGILADDMGLGKTIQVISFLSGMYDNERVRHTLLVMPTSLITNWTKEFSKWTPGMRVKEFHGTSKRERSQNLEKVQRRGGVVITTYNMLINNWEQLASHHGAPFTWDYLILDEAHKIKTSSTKTAKSASAIPSRHRILLTGTPVQNNLQELWALFHFACQGALLGTAKTFKAEYENPITRARERDATPGEKALGSRMSENLMALIKPYFLRRTKSEVQNNKSEVIRPLREPQEEAGQVPSAESRGSTPKLTRKNDLIVWTHLSTIQEDIYRQFLSLDHIKELLLTTRSPLAELTILKKLCDHPRLLSASAVTSLGLEESEADAQSIANVSDSTLIAESGKMLFLFELLQRLQDEGCRTLVFAHYRKVLDIMERILNNRGFKVLRLDGTITNIAERERRISLFQSDPNFSVFLLTTQVGGVGITLTAANRVVIFDPSWNPATDAQAVDRAYRIGQKENVVIYRLITCGTVEEKIYRRQVFKDSLIQQNTGDKKNPFRYFSKQELKELFSLEDTKSSSTQLQLQAMHARQRRTDLALDQHIAHLHTMHMFGISDHDLMFSQEQVHDEPDDPEEQHYIQNRVQKAQELMKAESELQLQITESAASFTDPSLVRPHEHSKNRNHQTRPRNLQPAPSPPQEPLCNGLMHSKKAEEIEKNNQMLQFIDLTEEEPDKELDQYSIKEPTVSSPEATDQLLYQSLNTEDSTRTPSVLLKRSTFKHEASSRISTGLESLSGHFNLQLEDSDAMDEDQEQKQNQDHLEKQNQDMSEEEQEEQEQLLSQLLLSGCFNVSKSLSERQVGADPSQDEASMDGSIITVKRRRVAMIYDEDEDDDEHVIMRSGLDDSLQLIGASTPKSSSSSLLRERRSTTGNISVASHRSITQEEMDDSIHEEEGAGSTCEDDQDEVGDGSHQVYSEEEEMEASPVDLNEEEEQDSEQRKGFTPEEEEDCSSDPELLSSEYIDHCTTDPEQGEGLQKKQGYDWLVMKGKEAHREKRLDEALQFFLRALDIQTGDPEIQLLTIRLFQQLQS